MPTATKGGSVLMQSLTYQSMNVISNAAARKSSTFDNKCHVPSTRICDWPPEIAHWNIFVHAHKNAASLQLGQNSGRRVLLVVRQLKYRFYKRYSTYRYGVLQLAKCAPDTLSKINLFFLCAKYICIILVTSVEFNSRACMRCSRTSVHVYSTSPRCHQCR
jgi:hypothetical protein